METRKTIFAIITVFCVAFGTNAQEMNNTYNYRVTAYKKSNNQVSSQSNVAEVTPDISIYLPNTFTPNGDGLNDTFGAVGEGVVKYTIAIYNRWGELVFNTDNAGEQWDGKYNGKLTQAGAYTYLIFANDDKKNVKKTGTVMLLL